MFDFEPLTEVMKKLSQRGDRIYVTDTANHTVRIPGIIGFDTYLLENDNSPYEVEAQQFLFYIQAKDCIYYNVREGHEIKFFFEGKKEETKLNSVKGTYHFKVSKAPQYDMSGMAKLIAARV